jgi:CTP-dependent riboflavin kinase
MAQLQLVVDHGKRHEVIRVADLLADYVDIIEIICQYHLRRTLSLNTDDRVDVKVNL